MVLWIERHRVKVPTDTLRELPHGKGCVTHAKSRPSVLGQNLVGLGEGRCSLFRPVQLPKQLCTSIQIQSSGKRIYRQPLTDPV